MNLYFFWILFLAIFAIVPLMIWKGRNDEVNKSVNTNIKSTSTQKGWFR